MNRDNAMSTGTNSDIKELKDLIVSLRGDIQGIDNRMITLETRMITLETRMTTLETKFIDFVNIQSEMKGKLSSLDTAAQKIPDLAERVGELKNWKQIALTLSGAFIGGIITYIARTPNP